MDTRREGDSSAFAAAWRAPLRSTNRRTRLRARGLLGSALALLAGCATLGDAQRTRASLLGAGGFAWTTTAEPAAGGALAAAPLPLDVYVERGSAAHDALPVIRAAAAVGFRQVLRYSGAAGYPERPAVFCVATRERMGDLLGMPGAGAGFASSQSVCVAWTSAGPATLTHELAHVMLTRLWGVPQRWISEGAAIDASGDWFGSDLDAACARLRAAGELPALADVLHRFGSLRTTRGYPAAGSFVRFLRRRYGISLVRRAWEAGRGALPQLTGRTLDELEAAWWAGLPEHR